MTTMWQGTSKKYDQVRTKIRLWLCSPKLHDFVKEDLKKTILVNDGPTRVLYSAVFFGDLDVMKFFHFHWPTVCGDKHMEWVKPIFPVFIEPNVNVEDSVLFVSTECGWSPFLMDLASSLGHLHLVQWLHENRSEGCTTNAMDCAAYNGHLDVIKFLHSHRKEGKSKITQEICLRRGHSEIAEFLSSHPDGDDCCSLPVPCAI